MPAVGGPLAPTYYLENFERMLAGVESRYGDLLEDGERSFLGELRALSRPARCLWLRLCSRKGPVFRRDRIDYPEVPDAGAALEELSAAGFVDVATGCGAAALLPLLLRGEIEELVTELRGSTGGLCPGRRPTKAELSATLVDSVPAAPLDRALRQRVGFVRPRRHGTIRVFRLLYFGNLRQDWTEFVLTDLELWRYESYPLRADLRRFDCRRAVDDVLCVAAMKSEIDDLLAGGAVVEAHRVLCSSCRGWGDWHAAARSSWAALACTVGRCLEREDRLDQALRLYEGIAHPPARERRTRVLARLDRPYDAIALCRQIDADPRDESERIFAPRFLHRLQRQLGQVAALHRRRRPRRQVRVERNDSRSVESLALEAVRTASEPGFHTENWLWRSLFGLLFWDVVFHPVAGAFEHPFQTAPLDLWSPSFRDRRSPRVELRLQEIREGRWPAGRVTEVWERKIGIRNALVRWTPDAHTAISIAMATVPGKDLAYVFDRLSRDLRRYRRGFPDLFVVRRDVSAGGGGQPPYELFEVKGPGDQLRPEQQGWLDYLTAGGISAHLLDVEWR